MTRAETLVAVVDDDESVRESLPELLHEFGFVTQTFASAEEFLASPSAARTRCLILDVAMPGMSGLELQEALRARAAAIPVVFITAQWDEAIRPRVLELGAVDCLFKPFSDAALIGAIHAALERPR
jgi:FixJ family two-component response regulator